MGRPPLPDPFGVGLAAEVIPVLLLGQPARLPDGLGGLAAIVFGAVLLVPAVAGVRTEFFQAARAFAGGGGSHGQAQKCPVNPSLSVAARPPAPPKKNGKKTEEEEFWGGSFRRRSNTCAIRCSNRPNYRNFKSPPAPGLTLTGFLQFKPPPAPNTKSLRPASGATIDAYVSLAIRHGHF